VAPELYRQIIGAVARLAQVPNSCSLVEIRDLVLLYRPAMGNYNRLEADVAQLVEQSIRNRQVIGSSPIVGSTNFFCFMNSPP
jgi:hypothetical protein